jgi:hypothetical protein
VVNKYKNFGGSSIRQWRKPHQKSAESFRRFVCYSLPRDAATIPTITTAKTASPTNSATVESMPNTVPPDGPAGPAGP